MKLGKGLRMINKDPGSRPSDQFRFVDDPSGAKLNSHRTQTQILQSQNCWGGICNCRFQRFRIIHHFKNIGDVTRHMSTLLRCYGWGNKRENRLQDHISHGLPMKWTMGCFKTRSGIHTDTTMFLNQSSDSDSKSCSEDMYNKYM